MDGLLPIAAAALAVFGAAFVQGVTGFAFGLLTIGFLSFLVGPREAVLLLAFLGPLISISIFWKVRRSTAWREALLLIVPLCAVGLPLGIWCFRVLDAGALGRIVGVLLVVSAGFFLTPCAPRLPRLPAPVAAAVGFLTGFLGGLTSTGGPPLVLYLYARDLEKEVRMAIMQAVFVVASLAKIALLPAMLPAGFLTRELFLHAAILLPPMLAGVLAGIALFRKVPAKPLRTAALVLLLGIGVVLAVSG